MSLPPSLPPSGKPLELTCMKSLGRLQGPEKSNTLSAQGVAPFSRPWYTVPLRVAVRRRAVESGMHSRLRPPDFKALRFPIDQRYKEHAPYLLGPRVQGRRPSLGRRGNASRAPWQQRLSLPHPELAAQRTWHPLPAAPPGRSGSQTGCCWAAQRHRPTAACAAPHAYPQRAA